MFSSNPMRLKLLGKPWREEILLQIATKASALSLTLKEIIDHSAKKQHVNKDPFLHECNHTSIMLMIYVSFHSYHVPMICILSLFPNWSSLPNHTFWSLLLSWIHYINLPLSIKHEQSFSKQWIPWYATQWGIVVQKCFSALHGIVLHQIQNGVFFLNHFIIRGWTFSKVLFEWRVWLVYDF